MSKFITLSNVEVTVQGAVAVKKNVTAMTKASPAVLTAAGHGLVVGDYVAVDLPGVKGLNPSVVRVSAVTADAVTLEGVDTTAAGAFGGGTIEKVHFDTPISTLMDIQANGGEAKKITRQTIHDDQETEVVVGRTAASFTSNSYVKLGDLGLAKLRELTEKGQTAAVMFKFQGGERYVFLSAVFLGDMPTGGAGEDARLALELLIRGRVKMYET